MCNIVTEFYLYSIVYIYLINSRLDVTTSVRHHFRTTYKLYHGVRLVVRIPETEGKILQWSSSHANNNNNNAGKFKEEFIAFQEAFREDFVNIQTSSETISYNHSILET